MDKELKPCPFCGGPAMYEDVKKHKIANIHCVVCPCEMTLYDGENATPEDIRQKLTGKWNRRFCND